MEEKHDWRVFIVDVRFGRARSIWLSHSGSAVAVFSAFSFLFHSSHLSYTLAIRAIKAP